MIEQVVICLFGISALWLSQSEDARQRRWAPVVALFAQPAWILATWEAQQFGMFALTLGYTAAWLRGIYTYWIRGTKA